MQCFSSSSFVFLIFYKGLLQAFMLGHTLLRGIVISHYTFYYLVAQYLFAGPSELCVSLLLLVSVPLLPDALNPFVSISLRGILQMGFFLGFTLFQLYYYNGVLQFNLTIDCSVMLCCQCHLQVLQATIFKLLVLKDHAGLSMLCCRPMFGTLFCRLHSVMLCFPMLHSLRPIWMFGRKIPWIHGLDQENQVKLDWTYMYENPENNWSGLTRIP